MNWYRGEGERREEEREGSRREGRRRCIYIVYIMCVCIVSVIVISCNFLVQNSQTSHDAGIGFVAPRLYMAKTTLRPNTPNVIPGSGVIVHM